ncbi:MAG: Transcriptional regulator, AcrR family [uncultured Rubellimicrobium sp.]|uniref:Transcriptional regulator, AcrR family n=1 Tax=uncultured Rubellimicrobium sp. TaxID=543078 RepID=A0A6J4PJ89_9RHOB|nr:MAG: Transcriptional regulator, AcrR family [uncultured Rubellimicrobium sp.]
MANARTEGRAKASARYHHGDLRAALLAAGEAELAERGVEGFSLRGAAARAGVSHAAPAHHFGDADGLLTALAAEGFTRFAAAMRRRQAALEAGGEGSDQRAILDSDRRNRPGAIDGAGLGYIDFARAHPALFRLMFASQRPDFADSALRAAAEDAFDILAGAVGAARGAGPWADEAGPADVAAAWALAHGLADLLLSNRLQFLRGAMETDPDGTALAIMRRLVLCAPEAEAGAGCARLGGS